MSDMMLLNVFVSDGFDVGLGNLGHVLLQVLDVVLVSDEAGFDQAVVDSTTAKDVAVPQIGPVTVTVVGLV